MNLLRRRWLLGLLCLAVLMLILAPTIVSHSGLTKSVLARISQSSGVVITADSIVVGWFTPLKLTHVTIGPDTTESHFLISQVNTGMTVFDLLRASGPSPREWILIDVRVHATFKHGRCDLVDDLDRLLAYSPSGGLTPYGRFRLEGMDFKITDADTGTKWAFADARAQFNWQSHLIDGEFLGADNAYAEAPTEIVGRLSGTASVTQKKKPFQVNSPTNSELNANRTKASKRSLDGTLEALTQKLNRGGIVWTEPNLVLEINALCDVKEGKAKINSTTLASDFCRSSLSGEAKWNSDLAELKLRGTTTLLMEQLASRLEDFIGDKIEFKGEHQSPVSVDLSRTADGEIALAAQGRIGWDSGEIAAMKLGPTSVPLRLDNANVYITPTRVPTGEGHVNLAGRIRYRPGPVSILLPAGELTHEVQITPEVTERWLRFIAPPVADVRGVDGKFDLEIDKGIIVPNDPLQHQVTGRLRVQRASFTVNPMIEELLVAVERHMLRTLESSTQYATEKVIMPTQTIEFELAQGCVAVKQCVIEVDGIPVTIRGDMALDGQVNMIARVPFDSARFKSQLQGKPGEVVELQIRGPIFHPSVARNQSSYIGSNFAEAAILVGLDWSTRMQRNLNKSFLKSTNSLNELTDRLHNISERVVEKLEE